MLVRGTLKETVTLYPRYHTSMDCGEYRIRRVRPNNEFYHESIDGRWRFQTNAQGYRNEEDFSYEKPDGVFRVFVVGDSHTQGYEVDQAETYSASLEKALEARGMKVQVINGGVSGFSNAEELVLLENEGLRYDIDLAVVGFFGNDFVDNLKAGFFELGEDGQLVATEKRAHLPGVKIQDFIYSIPGVQTLGENSYLYSLGFNTAWGVFKNGLARRAQEGEKAVADKEDITESRTALALALLRRMQVSCAAQGVPLVVVDIPCCDLEKEYAFAPSMPEEMRAEVREFADHFVDLSAVAEPFRGAARIHVPHGQHHLNSLGHAILGAELARVVDIIRGREKASAAPLSRLSEPGQERVGEVAEGLEL